MKTPDKSRSKRGSSTRSFMILRPSSSTTGTSQS